MIVLYDYLLFALELAGILYFMRGLPLREMGESEAVQRLFRSALLTVMPLLLALRSGLDGLQADQYGPFRLTELFGLLYVFVRLRYCISSRETLYYTFILFLVEIAVEKAAAAFALSREGMNLANHAVLLEYPVEATVYLLLPAGLTFGVFFLLKRFCIRVQPKQIGWRELVPMALSMVPVLTVGYLIEALESGHGTGVPDTLGLFLYELCSLTSVLVMIGVDNVAFMREEAQSALAKQHSYKTPVSGDSCAGRQRCAPPRDAPQPPCLPFLDTPRASARSNEHRMRLPPAHDRDDRPCQ